MISHQGICSYEIAQTCNITEHDLAFRVVATNRHRGNMAVSFISAVDVWLSQHGDQTQVTIEQNRKIKVSHILKCILIQIHLFSSSVFGLIDLLSLLSLQVNGISIDLPAFQINDLVEVHEEQGFAVLNVLNKLMVHFDGDSILLVRLSQRFNGSVRGMCGNFNGDPEDDKKLPCGGLAPDDNVFVNSWKSDISRPG